MNQSSPIYPLLALGGVAAILAISEALWQHKAVRGEFGRKFVHIAVGSYVAFWPYFLSWREIQVISLIFLVGITLSWRLNIFHAIHSVRRRTLGELFYALVIVALAFLAPARPVFAVAILHMAVADGFAAVLGKGYGKSTNYKVFGYTKSWVGTATFLVLSVWLIGSFILLHNLAIGPALLPLLIVVPLVATSIENLAVAGADNLLIPLFIAAVLHFYY